MQDFDAQGEKESKLSLVVALERNMGSHDFGLNTHYSTTVHAYALLNVCLKRSFRLPLNWSFEFCKKLGLAVSNYLICSFEVENF